VQQQFLNDIDIRVKINRNFPIKIHFDFRILLDEESDLLNEVTTRMAVDNMKTSRTVSTNNDSRIRGEIEKELNEERII